MFNDDYIMREIEGLAKFIAKSILRIETDENEVTDEFGNFSDQNFLLYRLHKMVDEGRINEAENELFDVIETDNGGKYLKTVYDFYDLLQKMTDEELTAANYSRIEIYDGIKDAAEKYGIEYNE